MRRTYFVNGFAESRKYFIERLGTITEQEFEMLANGKTIEKNGNSFYIKNFYGL